MNPHESRLLPDGRVFPPVTPDPPAPPGQEEIVVPEVIDIKAELPEAEAPEAEAPEQTTEEAPQEPPE